MKAKSKLLRLKRAKVWSGLFLLVAIMFGEFWMVLRFGRDCARMAAQHNPNPVVDVSSLLQPGCR